MHQTIYKLSREIAYILSVVSTLILLNQRYPSRAFLNIILSGLFICTSKLYEKRRYIVSPSYLFILIILFINNSICAAYYTPKTVDALDGSHGFWASDYYIIYFEVTLFCYLVILIYLLFSSSCDLLKKKNIKVVSNETKRSMISVFFCIILYIFFGELYEVLVPIYVSLFIFLLGNFRYKLVSIFLLIIVTVFGGYMVFQIRYILVEIVLPILLAILYTRKTNKKINIVKANFFLFVFCIAIGIYGIISEIIKLNLFWGKNIDLFDSIQSIDFIKDAIQRQVYRLFGIWIKLGGYIIYHVEKVGKFNGLTYIKQLSEVLDFEYISLPVISAYYNESTYAQPGLLAEGFANFGIIGSVFNICLVFFVMEYFTKRLIKNPTYSNLVYTVVPFTKILLDGGTLNSAIYMFFLCCILNMFNLLRFRYKRNCKISKKG